MNLTVHDDETQVAPVSTTRGAAQGDAVTLPGGIVPVPHDDELVALPVEPVMAPRGAPRRDAAPMVVGRDLPGPHLDGSHVTLSHGPAGTESGRDDAIAPDFLTTTPDPRPWTDDLPLIGG